MLRRQPPRVALLRLRPEALGLVEPGLQKERPQQQHEQRLLPRGVAPQHRRLVRRHERGARGGEAAEALAREAVVEVEARGDDVERAAVELAEARDGALGDVGGLAFGVFLGFGVRSVRSFAGRLLAFDAAAARSCAASLLFCPARRSALPLSPAPPLLPSLLAPPPSPSLTSSVAPASIASIATSRNAYISTSGSPLGGGGGACCDALLAPPPSASIGAAAAAPSWAAAPARNALDAQSAGSAASRNAARSAGDARRRAAAVARSKRPPWRRVSLALTERSMSAAAACSASRTS